MSDKIRCMVGYSVEDIDMDLYLEVHEQLAEMFRGAGLTDRGSTFA